MAKPMTWSSFYTNFQTRHLRAGHYSGLLIIYKNSVVENSRNTGEMQIDSRC